MLTLPAAKEARLTLSQNFEPVGYRGTRHDQRPEWAWSRLPAGSCLQRGLQKRRKYLGELL